MSEGYGEKRGFFDHQVIDPQANRDDDRVGKWSEDL